MAQPTPSEFALMQQRIQNTGKPDYSYGHIRCYDGPIQLILPTQDVAIKPPISILDIGSGCGFGYQSMIQHLRIENYLGIELDADSAYHHRSILKDENHKVMNDDFIEVMTGKDKYDFVFCIEVIEHVDRHVLDKFFEHIRTTLKQGGKLFLSTPEGNPKDEDYNPHGEYSETFLREILHEKKFNDVVVFRHNWTKLYICE